MSQFDERSPIYRQISEEIREMLLDGRLADDDQVMSTTQYAGFHRINPATVAKAFQALVDEGLLYKRRGIGMFVAPGAAEQLRRQRRADFAERMIEPMVAEAVSLGMAEPELLDLVRAAVERRITEAS